MNILIRKSKSFLFDFTVNEHNKQNRSIYNERFQEIYAQIQRVNCLVYCQFFSIFQYGTYFVFDAAVNLNQAWKEMSHSKKCISIMSVLQWTYNGYCNDVVW